MAAYSVISNFVAARRIFFIYGLQFLRGLEKFLFQLQQNRMLQSVLFIYLFYFSGTDYNFPRSLASLLFDLIFRRGKIRKKRALGVCCGTNADAYEKTLISHGQPGAIRGKRFDVEECQKARSCGKPCPNCRQGKHVKFPVWFAEV